MNINSLIDSLEAASTSWEIDSLEAQLDEAIEEAAEEGSYPRFGYTTAQRFETPEDWAVWKHVEARAAVREARARVGANAANVTTYVTEVGEEKYMVDIIVDGLAVDGWDAKFTTREAAEAAAADLIAEYLEAAADVAADALCRDEAYEAVLRRAIPADQD